MKAIKSYLSLQWKCNLFTDSVSGKTVSLYVDCYGDEYMKESRWGLFSVKREQYAEKTISL
jgi:hypothetical protein